MNVLWVLVMISAHALFLLIVLLPAGGAALPARERKRWQSARQCFSSSSICQEVFTLIYCSKSVLCVWDDKAFARVKLSSPPSDSLAFFHAIWLNLLWLSFLESKSETKEHEYRRWEIVFVFERDVNTDQRSDELEALVSHSKWRLSLSFRAGQH